MDVSLVQVVVAAAVLLLVSVFASKAAGRFGVPALLLFLAVGMLAGSDGPGGVPFDDPGLAQALGIVALAFILFGGGLDTSWTEVRPIAAPAVALATLGVLVTAVLTGWFASLLLDISLLELELPEQTLLVLVERDGQGFVPAGGTVIQAGDRVVAMTRRSTSTALRPLFEEGPPLAAREA